MTAIKDLLSEHLQRVIDACQSVDFRVRVHEVRKDLKKSRAALRMLRVGLGDKHYHRENAAIRDAGRPLTEARDAEVLLATFDGLAGKHAALGKVEEEVKRLLSHELEQTRRALSPELGAKIAHELRLIKRRTARHSMRRASDAAIRRGICRVYKKGRRDMRDAQRLATDDLLHEWRKQAKYLATQVSALGTILRNVRGRKRAKRLEKLGELLGEDHDLAVLRGKLVGPLQTSLGHAAAEVIHRLDQRLMRRRHALQDKSHRLGKRLYQLGARRFARKIERMMAAA